MILFAAVVTLLGILIASLVAYNQLHLETLHPLPYGACRHCRQLRNPLRNHGVVEIQTQALEKMEETPLGPTNPKT